MSAEEVLSIGQRLLHPVTGVMRGIHGEDDTKLLSIRVGELRRVERFVHSSMRFAASVIEAATAGETGPQDGLDPKDESAVLSDSEADAQPLPPSIGQTT